MRVDERVTCRRAERTVGGSFFAGTGVRNVKGDLDRDRVVTLKRRRAASTNHHHMRTSQPYCARKPQLATRQELTAIVFSAEFEDRSSKAAGNILSIAGMALLWGSRWDSSGR